MDNYTCKICEYTTKRQANYKRHVNSKKHLKNVSYEPKSDNNMKDGILMDPIWIPYGSHMDPKKLINSIKYGKKKQNPKVYLCNYCNDTFSGANNLARHKKVCGCKKETEMAYETKFKVMQNKIDMLEKSNEHQLEETKYYRQMLREAGGLVKKSVSSLTYAMDNYNNAPPIKTITINEIGFDDSEKKIVEDVLSSYKHRTLGVYLGNLILKLYKKDDPKDQSIWNTDDSRLTYLVKELLNNESSNWIVDKKGIKTKTYLIEPLLVHIKALLVSYQTNFGVPEIGQNSVELEMILENSKKLIELTNDIDDGVVAKEILKHISSHLKFSGKFIE